MRCNLISLNQVHLTCSQVEVLSHDNVIVAAVCADVTATWSQSEHCSPCYCAQAA